MDGIYSRQTNIDNDGNIQEFMPAQPLGMVCEYGNCKETNGADYIRKKRLFRKKSEWDEEPIFLCEKHSNGYIPYFKQTT